MRILPLFILTVLPQIAMSKNLAEPKPEDATRAMIRLLGHHDIVMFGEIHSSKQEYEWLCKLVKTPGFADHVDDIVVEFGNALYQENVDRYVTGEEVPFEQVQKAWRNMILSVPPVSPVYGWFYRAVREANLQSHTKHRIRLLMGSPPGDWDRIKTAEDLAPYEAQREQWYLHVVKDEVLARHHRACSSWARCTFFAAPIRLCRMSCLNNSTSPYRLLIGYAWLLGSLNVNFVEQVPTRT